MGVNVNSGTTSVSGSVTTTVTGLGLPKPSSTQTLVHAAVFDANAGTTIYTVPAGKRFYCLGFSIDCDEGGYMRLTLNGNNLFGGVRTLSAVGVATVVRSGGILLTAEAGDVISFGPMSVADVDIWGYTESV